MNRKGKPIVALIYDFDGTLAPGNMQEYSFINAVGMGKEEFWGETHKMSQGQDADGILIYMLFMLQEAKKKGLSITRESLRQFGKDIHFFKGVESWFQRINKIGLKEGVIVEHYINSSGLLEIMEGSKIAKHFKKLYASSFIYNEYGEAEWPARIINYTDKTQYLFRINKGCLDPQDRRVNAVMAHEDRPVAFNHMIYFGDGDTDVPSMAMLKGFGGYAVAVYQPHRSKSKARAKKLFDDGRVNVYAQADYSAGKKIDRYVKHVINKIAEDEKLATFK